MDEQIEGSFLLGNEFAEVRVRIVRTGNGARLEISSTRTGAAVRLCPLELESLTWQPPEVLSKLLAALSDPERSGKADL